MSDTSLEMQRMVAERYAAMSGAERLHVAAGMFDTVRAIILSSCPADASPDTRREYLRRRLYPELDLPADRMHAPGVHSP